MESGEGRGRGEEGRGVSLVTAAAAAATCDVKSVCTTSIYVLYYINILWMVSSWGEKKK